MSEQQALPIENIGPKNYDGNRPVKLTNGVLFHADDDDPRTRARQLLTNATPGPWHVGTDDSAGKDSLMLVCDYDDGSWREGYTGPFYLDPFTYDPTPMERATAELIAAAPQLIAELCDALDAATDPELAARLNDWACDLERDRVIGADDLRAAARKLGGTP